MGLWRIYDKICQAEKSTKEYCTLQTEGDSNPEELVMAQLEVKQHEGDLGKIREFVFYFTFFLWFSFLMFFSTATA